jgi:hypothetical protein
MGASLRQYYPGDMPEHGCMGIYPTEPLCLSYLRVLKNGTYLKHHELKNKKMLDKSRPIESFELSKDYYNETFINGNKTHVAEELSELLKTSLPVFMITFTELSLDVQKFVLSSKHYMNAVVMTRRVIAVFFIAILIMASCTPSLYRNERVPASRNCALTLPHKFNK